MTRARFIEVEVEAGNNCDFSLHRIFSVVEEPKEVVRVEAPGIRGELAMVEVIGWGEDGPCPAYAVRIEESGAGEALLVYGGDWGLRFMPLTLEEEWSLDSPNQWGENFLSLDDESQVRFLDPG